MTKQTVFVVWFCLLGMCFLVWPAQAQAPTPAQCLISWNYSLIRQPETMDEMSCWRNCSAEPDCHMAVVTKPLSGADQCLMVNCLNQGNYSLPRDPSAEINVYPKNTTDKEQRQFLMEGAYGRANERLRCFESMNHSSCQSGSPRFFYNRTGYRCERFSDCGLSRNTFETLEGCEALCNEKFRCYRPRQVGIGSAHSPKFFYNVTSQRCESFVFNGSGSNGNIFATVEECETLCADVKVVTTSQPAVDTVTTTNQPAADSDNSYSETTGTTGTSPALTTGTTVTTTSQPAVSVTTTNQPAADSVILCFVIPLALLLVIFVGWQYHRWFQCPSPISDGRNLLPESDESPDVESSEES